MVCRISQIVESDTFIPKYTKALINCLRDHISPRIPPEFIQGQWSARYKIDGATGDVTEVHEIRVPSIAVLEKEGREEEKFLGKMVGERDGEPVQGVWKKAIIWIDIWASNPIQRDNFASLSQRAIELSKAKWKEAGIVNMKLIRERENGFDMGDRILMNHSHQKMRTQRLILMYEADIRIAFPELDEREGTIEEVAIEIDDENDDLWESITVGGIAVPFAIEQEEFAGILPSYSFEDWF